MDFWTGPKVNILYAVQIFIKEKEKKKNFKSSDPIKRFIF